VNSKKAKRALVRTVVLAGLTVSGLAWADVPPPGMLPCIDKAEGATCDMENLSWQPTGEKGVCMMLAVCGSWAACGPLGLDGGSAPASIDASPRAYDCLSCEAADAGGTDGATGSDDAGSDSGSHGEAGMPFSDGGAVIVGADAAPNDAVATDAAVGAGGNVATGGAAGTAGTVATGGAAGTGGASGGLGTTGLGGGAGIGGQTVAGALPTETDGGGCSVGAVSAKNAFSPWLLSGGFAALLLMVHRQRRRWSAAPALRRRLREHDMRENT
jgi:hypothetical protein